MKSPGFPQFPFTNFPSTPTVLNTPGSSGQVEKYFFLFIQFLQTFQSSISSSPALAELSGEDTMDDDLNSKKNFKRMNLRVAIPDKLFGPPITHLSTSSTPSTIPTPSQAPSAQLDKLPLTQASLTNISTPSTYFYLTPSITPHLNLLDPSLSISTPSSASLNAPWSGWISNTPKPNFLVIFDLLFYVSN